MMRKAYAFITAFAMILLLVACGRQQHDLVEMTSDILDGKRAIIWEDRTYQLFCVISKSDRGEQIGYVDGDTNDRISEYKGYSPEEWLVDWMPTDGGAMLLKEQNVVDIPDGLEAEY